MTVAEIAEQMEGATTAGRADHAGDATPDEITDALEGADAIEAAPTSLSDRLIEPLEGSIYDRDIGELWNPEQGAENRLLLVAEEIGGLDGIPRFVHVAIGIAELVKKHDDSSAASSTTSSDDGAQEEEEEDDAIDETTHEVLTYDPS